MRELKYLTYSMIRDFLTCPEKGRLAHIERLRRPVVKSVLLLGTGIHLGIEARLRKGLSAVDTFEVFWGDALKIVRERGKEVEFRDGENEVMLKELGKVMLRKWESMEETPVEYDLLEESVYVEVKGIKLYGTIDYVGEGGSLLIDWKTSSQRYSVERANYDLQLTVYSYLLANTLGVTPKRVGFGVFVKKAFPEVQYVFGRQRTKEDFENLERIIGKIVGDVWRGEFYKNFGMHCQWCDYYGLCMGVEGLDSFVRGDGYYERYEEVV